MRIHYYEFPSSVDAHIRFKNGASNENGKCLKGNERCRGCTFNTGDGWRECEHYRCTESEEVIPGISITEAKRLLKEFGGMAYTHHIERDGGIFEVTPILLKGNNSKFKYNKHL